MTYIVPNNKPNTVTVPDFQISSLMTHTGQMMKKRAFRLGRLRICPERSKFAYVASFTREIYSDKNFCNMTPLWGHITLFELIHNKPT